MRLMTVTPSINQQSKGDDSRRIQAPFPILTLLAHHPELSQRLTAHQGEQQGSAHADQQRCNSREADASKSDATIGPLHSFARRARGQSPYS
jgi:hypothetical protein